MSVTADILVLMARNVSTLLVVIDVDVIEAMKWLITLVKVCNSFY